MEDAPAEYGSSDFLARVSSKDRIAAFLELDPSERGPIIQNCQIVMVSKGGIPVSGTLRNPSAKPKTRARLIQAHFQWYLEKNRAALEPSRLQLVEQLDAVEDWWIPVTATQDLVEFLKRSENPDQVLKNYRQRERQLSELTQPVRRAFTDQEMEELAPFWTRRNSGLTANLLRSLESPFRNVTGRTYHSVIWDTRLTLQKLRTFIM